MCQVVYHIYDDDSGKKVWFFKQESTFLVAAQAYEGIILGAIIDSLRSISYDRLQKIKTLK